MDNQIIKVNLILEHENSNLSNNDNLITSKWLTLDTKQNDAFPISNKEIERIKIIEQIKELELILAENFNCPISHNKFVDPVIADDGQTYEREHIIKWLKHSNLSPITKLRINPNELRTNFIVKSQISNFEEKIKALKEKLKKI